MSHDADERPPGATVNDCRVCQYLDAMACRYVEISTQMATVVWLREKHAGECPDPRGGGEMDPAAVRSESSPEDGQPMGDGTSAPGPAVSEPPSGPGALEPAESATMRRLREGMARYRHHH